jgi:PAS domain S-box-containing protein
MSASSEQNRISYSRRFLPAILLVSLLVVTIFLWWTYSVGVPFNTSRNQFTSISILVSGMCFSLLLFFMAEQREKKFQMARILAQTMTAELATAHKQANELARKTELILNSAGEGVVGLDIEGRTVFMNPAAADMLGLTPQELIGQKIHFTQHAQSHDAPNPFADCPIQLTLQDGQPHQMAESLFWRKNGIPFPVKYSSTPIWDESSQLAGAVLTFNDITEHLRAEKDRFARQVADQSNKTKSAFLANMSHEIRTPMNGILGCTQLLLNNHSFSTRQTELLQVIDRSGRHLLNLINDILDISKIEAGQISLHETVLDLSDLLEEMKTTFHLSAENKGLQFIVDYSENLPHSIMTDGGKLRQILVNLLGNGIKFTDKGTVMLRVAADIVQGKTAQSPEILHLLFEIEDTGAGISPKDQSKIFIPFEQTTTGVKAGGTGLGLSISSKLVQLLGGSLTVESHVGQGSCFRFYIRAQSCEIILKQEEAESQRVIGLQLGTDSDTESVRILVADDNEINRSYLRHLLEMTGFEVIEAANGQEALHAFEKDSPHAVLMDIQMPVMDGLEATKRIKDTDKGKLTPIIAITGNACEDLQNQGLKGLDACLCKPFCPEELFKILGRHLGLAPAYQENNSGTTLNPLSPAPANITPLPRELLTSLRQAVEEGDSSRLRQLIAKVKENNGGVAMELQTLADQYNYKKIYDLLEDVMK